MARVKAQRGEDLSDFMVGKVAKLLTKETPISKREACDLLKIKYNTTRLAKIIEAYEERKTMEKRRRKEMRTKPVTDAEKARMITMYLQEAALEDISSVTFRSTAKIKTILDEIGVPKHDGKVDYFRPEMLDDKLVREQYEVGDYVWTARYGSVAEVTKKFESNNHGMCYQLWLIGKNGRFVNQPWYELGHLDCLKDYNISVKQLTDN